jgi:hypothetical protein
MTEDEVDVIEAKPFERAVDPFTELLAVEGRPLIHPVVHPEEDLGGHHVARAPPAQLAQGAAHDLLRLSRLVRLGVVEEVHPGLPRCLHAGSGRIDIDLLPVGDPRAVGKNAHLEARAS